MKFFRSTSSITYVHYNEAGLTIGELVLNLYVVLIACKKHAGALSAQMPILASLTLTCMGCSVAGDVSEMNSFKRVSTGSQI